jgi:hypothetical protein
MNQSTFARWAFRLVPCALMAALSSACLVSTFHPLYDDASIVFDEALIGRWENPDSQIAVTVARSEWRSYKIDYTERTTTTHFTAFLTELSGARFLSVRPEDGLERPAFVVATNGPLQVQVEAAQVRVRELDYDELLKRFKARTLKIAAATDLKQNLVITAETPALRQWMVAALKDPALWAEWKTLSKK